MRRDHPPRRSRDTDNSPLIPGLHSRIQSHVRIALAIGFLAFFGLHGQGLCAATSPAPAGLTVQRSTRVFPHRFNVHPDGATIAVDQTQRFEVTDAQGKTVAVHWNISGLGCAGLACGTIDDQGVYRTPSTLPHPGVIILEGVLDSNPNYSVLTQIELVPAAKLVAAAKTSGSPSGNSGAVAASTKIAVAETQEMPSLPGQSLTRNTDAPPLPNAVAAAPVVERQNVARAAQSPQPGVTRPLPVIEGNNFAPEHSLLPLPSAVAAAPAVQRQIVTRAAQAPQPRVTQPLPTLEQTGIAPTRAVSLQPAPIAVAAAPVAGQQSSSSQISSPQIIARASAAPPLSIANVPQPVVESKSKSVDPRHSSPSLPKAVAAASIAETQTISLESVATPASVSVRVPTSRSEVKTVSSGQLAQNAANAAPTVDTKLVARAVTSPLPSNVVAPSPTIAGSEGRPGEKAVATSPLPRPDAVAAAPMAQTQTIARNFAPLPSPKSPTAAAINPTPVSGQTSRTQPITASLTGTLAGTNVASRAILQPLQDEAAASSTAKTAADVPMVTYRDGQLTIDAQNSTLAEVLKLVAEKSGAKIEIPPGSGLERIYEHAGPGPAQDVLIGLLNGSPYDFVIVSSPQAPNAPAQVLLSLRGTEPAANAAVASNQVAQVRSAAVEPRPSGGNPYMWTPPASSPMFSNGESEPVVQHLPAVAPPTEPIAPEVLEQMLKDYGKQLRGGPPPQSQ
jgi:hypothetical protein